MSGYSTIQVDPAGDLRLLVKHNDRDKNFQVSSKAMSLASPVWRTMLDPSGPFREAKPDNGEIAFPEDDAEALLTVLLAAHLRQQEVPQTSVGYKQLLEICVVCDKYDCIQLMRPWISKWEASLANFADKDTYEEWLFIAWTTGDDATFECIARKLAFKSYTNLNSGHCLTLTGKELGGNMPPGIVDGIVEARHQTLIKLIQVCHSIVDQWGHKKERSPCTLRSSYHSEDSPDKDACDALVLGSFIPQLQALRIWPADPSELASGMSSSSVASLSAVLQTMTCHTYPGGRHTDCGFVTKLREGAQKIVANMPTGIQESHRTHMARQRQKLSQSNTLFKQLQQPDHEPLTENQSVKIG